MKILITGASGFVGKHLLNQLGKSDHEIIVSTTKDNETLATNVKSKFFDLDHLDYGQNYYEYFHKPDVLIHLAWQGLPNYKKTFHFEKNLPGHFAFLKNMVQNGLKNITVSGTCLEYGNIEGRLYEKMPTNPDNSYAIAKDSLRKYLQVLQKETEFKLNWVRLFYMYGEGQNPNSLLSQLEKALAEGKESFDMSAGQQLRDYLPVEKVAEYIAKIALQQDVSGVINCCSGVPVSVKEFVIKYLERTGRSIKLNLGVYPYADYEPMAFWGDTTKLKTIIDR